MKSKIAKIWSVGLVAVMLVSLFGFAIPASAGTLSFSAYTSVPSATGNMLKAGDITSIAVAGDGSTIYAVTGNSDNLSYKSQDAGKTWTAMSDLTARLTAKLIAVAPDDPTVLVAVGGTNNLTAYVSINGGSNWSTMNVSTTSLTAVYGLDISALSAGTRYAALAGTGGADTPMLYYFNLGSAAPSWIDAANDSTWTATTIPSAADAFMAVKFSPNFASDQVAVAVSSEIGTTSTADYGYARFHILSFNQKKWDSVAGFGTYPVTMESYTSNATAFVVNNAAITLDPQYLGGDDASRIAFVGMSVTNGTDEVGGIYREKDTTNKVLKDTTGIYSIGWDGTNLVAGATASNIVYRSADALSTDPTVSSATSLKRPGGSSNVLVAWNGADVVAATAGTSSAFAVSGDNGKTFNDISLIDTTLTNYKDVALAADASKTYMLTDNGTAGKTTSLWRKDSSGWQRVWWTTTAATSTYIVRISPDSADVVYVSDTGLASSNMWYTTDAGQTKWFTRSSRYAVQDLAVESTNVAYVAQYNSATVSKSTNGGFTWGTAKDTELSGGTISTIASLGTDKLIVGSSSGYVAYSADGNSSWSHITKVTAAGAAQVTASGLASGDYIYVITAATSAKVYRWQIGTSTSWKDTEAPTTTSFKGYGIQLFGSILYAITGNVSGSQMLRTLNPTSASGPTWSSVDSADETFAATPSALRVTSGTKIWAVNTATSGQQLWSYSDILATAGPTLIAPANKFQNPMNPITGRSVDVAFSWDEPDTTVTSYQVKIYADAAGDTLIKTITTGDTVVLAGPYQTSNTVEFGPGATYYWRVRTNGPIYSPYSEMRSFTIQPGTALVPTILSPSNGNDTVSKMPSFSWSPVSGSTSYEFKLADNVYLNNAIVDTTVLSPAFALTSELEYGKVYYWAVRALAPVQGDWSAVSNFTVMMAPTTAAPPIVITSVPAPIISIPAAPPATSIVIPAAPPATPIVPAFIWAIIIIGAVLVIAVIILIVRTRRAV
ncbi:MAG: hypothetical protein V1691_01750 [Chloroflexota bacterium]